MSLTLKAIWDLTNKVEALERQMLEQQATRGAVIHEAAEVTQTLVGPLRDDIQALCDAVQRLVAQQEALNERVGKLERAAS